VKVKKLIRRARREMQRRARFRTATRPQMAQSSRGGGPVRRRGNLTFVVVIDGLRPDSIDPRDTPNLHRLRTEGTDFANAHAVFPTGTRVNAAALVTGTYPGKNGLLGNIIVMPGQGGGGTLNTQSHADLLRAAPVNGRLLLTDTLGEILARDGRMLAAVSSASTGSTLLLNPAAAQGTGVLVNGAFEPGVRVAYPDDANREILDRFGPAPRKGRHGRSRAAFIEWTHQVLMEYVVPELGPDVVIDWISEPDHSQHAYGVGSPEGRRALAEVDRQIGILRARVSELGLSERTHLFVLSDHGVTRYGRAIDVERTLVDASLKAAMRSDDVVVTQNGPSAQLFVDGHDPGRIRAIVSFLQRQDWSGPVFTRSSAPGGDGARASSGGGRRSPDGWVEGTFSLELLQLFNAERSCDVLLTFVWGSTPNEFGIPGTELTTTFAGKRALHSGHGGPSPWAIRSTLVAVGPRFRAGAVVGSPVGHVDLVPTILALSDIQPPPGLDGRVLTEALAGSPDPDRVEVEAQTFTTSTADGSYQAAVQLSGVEGHQYLDAAWRLGEGGRG
jgi:arylsulfatase A-like enzyme